MTPISARDIIKAKFPVLLNRDMIRIACKGKLLIITGSAMAVQAVDKYVMQGLIPTKCKAHEKSQDGGKAIYTYKF